LVKEVLDKKMSEAESHLQEERRLFYVGATRAKEKLYLSAAISMEMLRQKRSQVYFFMKSWIGMLLKNLLVKRGYQY
jgi:superfamily I DNA/RNA helicase